MAARQLWLFDPPKPLVERLGEDFFSGLPTGPGVYLMCGEAEGVLYVGKARNLRKRLSSYRVANPERMPRRIIRLLHQVRRIEWDECPSEAAASEREELLICVLGPKFNSVGKVWERRRRDDASKCHPECHSAIQQIDNLRYDAGIERAEQVTRLALNQPNAAPLDAARTASLFLRSRNSLPRQSQDERTGRRPYHRLGKTRLIAAAARFITTSARR